MEEHFAEPTDVRCPICQKPYSNGANRRARSKHLSYCRKKRQSISISRRKACDECVRAKVRCTYDLAGCSRCISRGYACSYPGITLHPGSRNPTPAPTSSHESPLSQCPVSCHESGVDDATLVTQTSSTNEHSLVMMTSIWDNAAAESWSGSDFLDLLTSPSGNMGIYTQALSAVRGENMQSPKPRLSIPASLSEKNASSMLERRQFPNMELEVTSDMALHILRSYIHMMADGDSPPPFIHPKYRDFISIDTGRPSPLSAAMKLAKMLVLGRGMNKTLIWRLIRMEQERLLSDHPKFKKWESLEALQSLILYILMRINEGRRDYTNFDTQLLISVNALCWHISSNFGMFVNSHELNGEMLPWDDWVFSESRRRAATVIMIIDSILYARISELGHAMSDYNVAPAPSPRELWEASDELVWAAGYAGHLHTNAAHGMLKNRDLVTLREAAGENDNRWYAYADSFGLLVTLVANLII